MHKFNNEAIEKFYEAILSLENIQECKLFFDDVCTIQELDSIAQRLEVARLLSQGKSYAEINQVTGASTATICRVSKAMERGKGGYKLILERVGVDEE